MWSLIANQLPGRTDNDVKNYWNTKLSKKLRQRGIDPITHRPIADLMQSIGSLAIRPPAAATAASSSHLTTTTTSFLPSTKPMLAPLLDPYTGPVVHDTSAPAAVASPELKWSDFLADGNDAALGSYGGGGVLQDVVFDQEGVVLGRGGGGGSGGGGVQGSGGGCDAGAGHDDPAAAAFIDAILECDKEMAADELISELLADPSYYCCSSSEMGWDC